LRTTSRLCRRAAPFIAGLLLLSACDPMKRQVTYRVLSKANAVDVTSLNAYGESDERIVKPPWTLSFLAVPHALLSVTAQAMGPRGEVSCAITVDGKTLQSADAKGEGSAAACSFEAP
jgi:hypothetical protein